GDHLLWPAICQAPRLHFDVVSTAKPIGGPRFIGSPRSRPAASAARSALACRLRHRTARTATTVQQRCCGPAGNLPLPPSDWTLFQNIDSRRSVLVGELPKHTSRIWKICRIRPGYRGFLDQGGRMDASKRVVDDRASLCHPAARLAFVALLQIASLSMIAGLAEASEQGHGRHRFQIT